MEVLFCSNYALMDMFIFKYLLFSVLAKYEILLIFEYLFESQKNTLHITMLCDNYQCSFFYWLLLLSNSKLFSSEKKKI